MHVHVNMQVYVFYACVYVCKYACVYVYVHVVYVCICVNACMCVCVYVCALVYVCMYVYACMCMYVCCTSCTLLRISTAVNSFFLVVHTPKKAIQ